SLRLLHLGLLLVECLNLLGHTLLSGLQRRLKGLAFTLLMAVGTDDLLTPIVGPIPTFVSPGAK
ncbi:MAG: hypothetical protein V3R80_04790, partial [Candidatus Tectomicrobia bacterium]